MSPVLKVYFCELTADILRACGALPEKPHSALPAASHNTTLPVPQNLSVFGHVFPQGSNLVEIRIKSRNRFQDSNPGNSIVFNNNRRILSIPSRTRLHSGVTNHHVYLTIDKVKKWLTVKSAFN